jgi:hypothetical protein
VYEGQAYPMLMSVHLSIVSRMILSYKPEFQEFLNALATENGNHSDDIAAQILDVWMDKMPCVTQPERRKLLSLGTSIHYFITFRGKESQRYVPKFPFCPTMSLSV